MTMTLRKHFPLIAALIAAMAAAVTAATAEPTKLKLAFFGAEQSQIYAAGIKPFVDAVNADAKGLLEIEVFFDGRLGQAPAQQPELVTDGVADLAFIIPGYTPDRFPDTAIIELPGLFRDGREATLSYSHLIASNSLQGYQDFLVIGAFASEPVTIHANRPVRSLADLVGLKIRAHNATEAVALTRLDVQSAVSPINEVTEAISSGRVDGTLLSPTMLFEFNVAHVTNYHFLLQGGVAPLALVMNRAKYLSLPASAQDIIRKYSGDWTAGRYNNWSARTVTEILTRLNADPRRSVVYPSRQDLERARIAFKFVVDKWAAQSAHNHDLLTTLEAEIAKQRANR